MIMGTNKAEFTNASIFDGLQVDLALSEADLKEVYALRYQAYVAEGALEPRAVPMFIDRYDLLQTSAIVVVRDAGEIVGSIRMAVQPGNTSGIADFLSSPEFQVFPDLISDLECPDRPMISGARFAIQPKHRRRKQIAMLILYALVSASGAVGAKWALATARGSHLAFYRRMLLMKEISEPRLMPGLTLEYALLASDVDKSLTESLSRFPKSCRAHFTANNADWNEQVTSAIAPIAQWQGEAA